MGYAGTELSEVLVRSIMEDVGADSGDVAMVDVGFDLMSSMTTGSVDATIGCLKNHEVPQLIEEGFDVSWFDLYDYGVPVYYEGVFLAGDSAVENDRETLSAFLRASAKGFADMRSDPEEALKILLSNQNEENFPVRDRGTVQHGGASAFDGDGGCGVSHPVRRLLAGEYRLDALPGAD